MIHQFIVQQNLSDLTLVGHSMGGAVALLVSLMLIKEEPQRLSTLVLIDSAGYKQKLPASIDILTKPIIRSIVFTFLSDKKRVRCILKKAYWDDTKITRDQVSAYAEPLGSDGAGHALVKTANKLKHNNTDHIAKQLGKITVPTLIIWGRKDKIIPLEFGEKFHEQITNSEIVIIDNCGHIPHEEEPVETTKILLTFLQRHRK